MFHISDVSGDEGLDADSRDLDDAEASQQPAECIDSELKEIFGNECEYRF